jgi:hypothetical protein
MSADTVGNKFPQSHLVLLPCCSEFVQVIQNELLLRGYLILGMWNIRQLVVIRMVAGTTLVFAFWPKLSYASLLTLNSVVTFWIVS